MHGVGAIGLLGVEVRNGLYGQSSPLERLTDSNSPAKRSRLTQTNGLFPSLSKVALPQL